MAKRCKMWCLSRIGQSCDCGANPSKPLPGQMTLPMPGPLPVPPAPAPTPKKPKTAVVRATELFAATAALVSKRADPLVVPRTLPGCKCGPDGRAIHMLGAEAFCRTLHPVKPGPVKEGLFRCACGIHVLSARDPTYKGHSKEVCHR